MVQYPDFLVGIRCMTYNHHAYIEDAMNGFTMQQTTFPFVCTIIDDASTDGEPDVILRYMNDHFDLAPESGARQWETDEARFLYARHRQNPNCYFGIVLLKTNYYSQQKSKEHLMTQWLSDVKYYALCEGDDYWIYPNKLHMQVDFMESHPDYSMCWHDAEMISARSGERKGRFQRYTKDCISSVEDVILGGGNFCPTASLLFKRDIRENAPKFLFNQYVGDYPLQMYMAFSGKVYYMARTMCVYRVEVGVSWITNHFLKDDIEKRRDLWDKEFKIYDDFNKYSKCKYSHIFEQRKYLFLFEEYWRYQKYGDARKVWYKIDWNKRTWNLRKILYLHGYAKIRNLIKM